MSTTNLTHSSGHGIGYGNATLLAHPRFCTLDTCDLSLSAFLYRPTVAGNAIFATIFALLFVGQVFLGIKHKTWGYMAAMLLGLFLEVLGYVGRVLIHENPFDNNDFLMYLITLTIAPALLTGAIYLCLSRIVIVFGEDLSRFKPRTYTAVFCSCDFLCLVLQGLGGGIAATANTQSGSDLGKNIMLAGLIIQVLSLTLFAIACAEFFSRVRNSEALWNQRYTRITKSGIFKFFLIGLAVATLTIFIRSVYRCAELAGGFNGSLFTKDEAMFMILEGLMIIVATSFLTLLHPGVAFQGVWAEANFTFRTKKGANRGTKEVYVTDEESLRQGSGVAVGQQAQIPWESQQRR